MTAPAMAPLDILEEDGFGGVVGEGLKSWLRAVGYEALEPPVSL